MIRIATIAFWAREGQLSAAGIRNSSRAASGCGDRIGKRLRSGPVEDKRTVVGNAAGNRIAVAEF